MIIIINDYMTENTIYFHGQIKLFREFSNFYDAEIKIDNIIWPTSEHYFQAMKFKDTNKQYMENIRNATSPALAKKKGGNKQIKICDDWEDIKEDIMMIALRAKFTQHRNLNKILLDTHGKYLVEHTDRDSYWGDGGNGSGKNRLGILLMKLRDELIMMKK